MKSRFVSPYQSTPHTESGETKRAVTSSDQVTTQAGFKPRTSSIASNILTAFIANLMAGCALITFSSGTNPLAAKTLRTYRIGKKSLPISCKTNSSTTTIRSMSSTISADSYETETITSSPEYMRFQTAATMTHL